MQLEILFTCTSMNNKKLNFIDIFTSQKCWLSITYTCSFKTCIVKALQCLCADCTECFCFFSITVLALLWPDSPLAFYTLSCSRRATCCSLMSSSLPLSIRFVRTKRLTVNYGIREYNIPWNHHCLRGSNVCGFRGSMNLHVYPHEHTYKHLFFKYLFKLSLPTKLRPYNEESFGYPQTLPPHSMNENDSTP